MKATRAIWISLSACMLAVCTSCDGTPPETTAAPLVDDEPHLGEPPVPMNCEDVTKANTPNGLARLRFSRVTLGMMAQNCGMVLSPDDPLKVARYLQGRLEQQPGCEECVINRVDEVTMLDVELVVTGEWRCTESAPHPYFFTFMPDDFDGGANPTMQLENAHYYFVRDGESFEVFHDFLCPGSNPDPSVPGLRRVSDDCMVFHERPAPHIRQPGFFWEDGP